MAISKSDVIKVAHLARLNLNEGELELFSRQLESILEFIDKLKQVDVSSVKPMSHVFDMGNVLRKDTAEPSLDRDEVFRNSPSSLKDHFRVPKVIE